MRRIATDRSRIETAQHCARERWYTYHEQGSGIVPSRKSLPLAVGGSVHKGLEVLLRESMNGTQDDPDVNCIDVVEDRAVEAALDDFAGHHDAGLELDLAERSAMAQPVPTDADAAHQMRQDLSASLGMTLEEAGLDKLGYGAGNGPSEGERFEDYLYAEQSALVEALVRAYARRRLRPLLEEFEVLEVEREGEWVLAEYLMPMHRYESTNPADQSQMEQILFLSRPDALLRSRTDNSLYLLSYKTAATWDVRKERDAQHDMQGLSEGIEVERRLGEWWGEIETKGHTSEPISTTMYAYLRQLPAPPRVLGIRYEYILKGYRGEDKDLSRRFGVQTRSQRSHLIRRYVAHSTPKTTRSTTAAYSVGDVCWSYDYLREDGTESKLAWSNWSSEPVWTSQLGVKRWIDALDQTAMAMSAYDSTVGMEPREMGFQGPAQAVGFTKTHPLDEVFMPPVTVYRQDDDLRDLVEQMEAQERRVAEAVAQVEAAENEEERRSLLNQHFTQTRRACEYPSTCAFVKLCYGGEEIRHSPLDSGLFRRRIPNHAREADFVSISPAEK